MTGAQTGARRARAVQVAVPVAFLAVFFAWPLVSIFAHSLRVAAIRDVVTDPALRRVAWFTLWQAVVSTILTLVVGLPAAYVVARFDFPGRRAFRAFVTVPFVLPTVVVATAFLALLRPGGPLAFLHWQRGIAPMLVAHVFFNVAVVVRTVGGFWANLDPRREEAARMLGASRVRAFRYVTLPLLAPSIIAAGSIVFLFTFTSFGVALLLSDPAHATLEVEIYRQAVELFDLRTAAALALVQIVAVLAVVFALARAQERRGVAQRLVGGVDAARRARGRERAVVGGVVGGTTLFLGAPLAVLVWRSLHIGGHWSLSSFRALGSSAAASTLFVSPWAAVRNSLEFAVIATVIALVVGGLASVVIAARGGGATRTFDAFLMLPLGTSAVTVGFGFLLAFRHGPAGLATSPLLVPIAHAVVAVPFVVRAVVPALRSIDPRLRDAATMLGAGPRRVWREVDLPITARAFAVAAGFCAAVSLGEFGATLFIARPDWPTVPIAIQRFLARPGEINVDQALAMSVILMALTAVVVFAIERVRVRDLGELQTVLQIEGATVRFGGRAVLDHVDLLLDAAETVAVLGPSGSGKTTLLRAVAGLQRLDGGRICWDGEDLAPVASHERQFGLVFQEYALFPHRDVAGNVEFGLQMTARRPGARGTSSRVSEMLELVGLAGFGSRRIASLSGGEQQRVALARALAVSPRLLMLDEPLGALDVVWRRRLLTEIRAILDRAGLAAMYVTHDHEEAFSIAARVAIMRDGRVVQIGAPADVWRAPADPWTAMFLGFGPVVGAEVRDGLVFTPWGPIAAPAREPAGAVDVVVRPDGARLDPGGPIDATVVRSTFTGTHVELAATCGPGPALTIVVRPADAARVGDRVRLSVDSDALLVYRRPAD